MKFSIITVALNPGEKLQETLDSVFSQTYQDYEVILKDGGSTDGSMDRWIQGSESDKRYEKVRFFQEKDRGIYDAMNQAAVYATGDFVVFLNCGDVFADEKVLENTNQFILDYMERQGVENLKKLVFYGDTYGSKLGVAIQAAPAITGFTCYRNIPCHQSCFYSLSLCQEKPYDLQYKIRADYEHFLWCFYEAGASFVPMHFCVSAYEGDGFSERKDNRKRDSQEHRSITKKYMGKGELFRYRLVMGLTLAPVRRRLAESNAFSGLYHKIKELLYKK